MEGDLPWLVGVGHAGDLAKIWDSVIKQVIPKLQVDQRIKNNEQVRTETSLSIVNRGASRLCPQQHFSGPALAFELLPHRSLPGQLPPLLPQATRNAANALPPRRRLHLPAQRPSAR